MEAGETCDPILTCTVALNSRASVGIGTENETKPDSIHRPSATLKPAGRSSTRSNPDPRRARLYIHTHASTALYHTNKHLRPIEAKQKQKSDLSHAKVRSLMGSNDGGSGSKDAATEAAAKQEVPANRGKTPEQVNQELRESLSKQDSFRKLAERCGGLDDLLDLCVGSGDDNCFDDWCCVVNPDGSYYYMHRDCAPAPDYLLSYDDDGRLVLLKQEKPS